MTRRCLVAIAASVAFGASALAQDKSVVVASTTSTQDSGLFVGNGVPRLKGGECRANPHQGVRRCTPAIMVRCTRSEYNA